jgi:polar amino acid transport system substrate-binding protein
VSRNLQCALLLFMLCAFSCAWAGEYSFVTLEFPPIEYTGRDGKVEGFAVEMVTTIMNKLGHTLHIKAYPWTRALAMVQEGNADAIFTAYETPEREERLDYCTQSLFPQVIYFYKTRGSDITFDGNLIALKGKRIGVVSTISYGNKFDHSKTTLHVEKANQLEHNFQKLLLGRIDLVVSNVYTGEYTIRKLGLNDEIMRLPQEIEAVPSYVAFSKKRNLRTLRDQFDREIAELKNSGDYAKILNKYGVEVKESSK